jgi:hypothetical protein
MKIKVLKPRDDESKRLVDWIDSGAYDAISKGVSSEAFDSLDLSLTSNHISSVPQDHVLLHFKGH